MDWLENFRRSFLDWDSMAEVLPSMIAVGLKNTLILAAASTVLGVVIGMILAVMGISRISLATATCANIHRHFPRAAGDRDHPNDRARIRPYWPRTVRPVAVSTWYHRAEPDRRRIHRRNLPRRHPKRRARPDGGLPGPQHELRAGHATDRHSAGRATRIAGAGQPVHRQRQGFQPCLLPRTAGVGARDSSGSDRTRPW